MSALSLLYNTFASGTFGASSLAAKRSVRDICARSSRHVFGQAQVHHVGHPHARAAATSPHVSLIQGASRGLGLELTTQLLSRPDTTCVVLSPSPPLWSVGQLRRAWEPCLDGLSMRFLSLRLPSARGVGLRWARAVGDVQVFLVRACMQPGSLPFMPLFRRCVACLSLRSAQLLFQVRYVAGRDLYSVAVGTASDHPGLLGPASVCVYAE
jgi:hypothetical protein